MKESEKAKGRGCEGAAHLLLAARVDVAAGRGWVAEVDGGAEARLGQQQRRHLSLADQGVVGAEGALSAAGTGTCAATGSIFSIFGAIRST